MTKIAAYKSASGVIYEDRDSAAVDEMRMHLIEIVKDSGLPREVGPQLITFLITNRSKLAAILTIEHDA